MKHLKTFESIKDLSLEDDRLKFENALDIIAIYFENIIGINQEDGFIECVWSDYDYNDMCIIYFEFSFTSHVDEIIDDFDNKIDEFFIQYDSNYTTKFYNNYYTYIIAINSDKLEQIFNDINDAYVYNL